jgi:thymidylate synthase
VATRNHHDLTFIDGREAFKTMLSYVHEEGEVRSPRGLKTYDVGYTTIHLLSPYNALTLGVGRKLSKRIAAAEAIQLIGGFADPQLLLRASPNFARYIEPSGEFWGAYGSRIAAGKQLPAVVRKLEQDPDTRQAIVTLWNPWVDNDPGHKDYPCTLSLGFSIQRGKLELDVTMRSNDVWRGLPYDLFQFTQLQLTVANVLDLQPGRYRHHTYSLHLYAEDADEAMNVYLGNVDEHVSVHPTGFSNNTVDAVMQRCKWIAEGSSVVEKSLDESERWYWNALHPAE